MSKTKVKSEKKDTRETRRNLRSNYRYLMQDMQDNKEECIDAKTGKLQEMLRKGNKLYAEVENTREAALDSEFFSMTASYGVDQTQRFQPALKEKYDAFEFVSRLTQYINHPSSFNKNKNNNKNIKNNKNKNNKKNNKNKRKNDSEEEEEEDEEEEEEEGITQEELNWTTLGLRVQPFFHTTPSISFLFGSLGEEEKNNNKKKARKVVREKVTEPQVIAKEGIDTLNQIGKETTQSVEQLHNIIKKTAKYEKNPQKNNNNINDKEKINFYELINDPLDFGQTIENLFHLSFLVKDGHVKFLDDNQTPSITAAKPPSAIEYENNVGNRKQTIVTLTYDDWEQMKNKYPTGITEHRDYTPLLSEYRKRKKDIEIAKKRKKQKLNNSNNEDDEDEDKNNHKNNANNNAKLKSQAKPISTPTKNDKNKKATKVNDKRKKSNNNNIVIKERKNGEVSSEESEKDENFSSDSD